MEQDLLQELQEIQQQDYAVPEETDAYPYAQIMMESISADDELRELIEEVLIVWVTRGMFRPKAMRGLLLQALSPGFLLYEIEQNKGAFRRTSSARIVGSLVSFHECEPFLSQEQLESVAEQLIEYIYMEEKAEGLGYALQALKTATRCLKEEQSSLLYALLEAVKEKLYTGVQLNELLSETVHTVWETGFVNEMYMAAWIVSLLEEEHEEAVRTQMKDFFSRLLVLAGSQNENIQAVLEDAVERM